MWLWRREHPPLERHTPLLSRRMLDNGKNCLHTSYSSSGSNAGTTTFKMHSSPTARWTVPGGIVTTVPGDTGTRAVVQLEHPLTLQNHVRLGQVFVVVRARVDGDVHVVNGIGAARRLWLARGRRCRRGKRRLRFQKDVSP